MTKWSVEKEDDTCDFNQNQDANKDILIKCNQVAQSQEHKQN